MNPVLAAGLLIGVLCGAWTFVMGFTGWYKDPAMLWLFFAVILIEVVGLVWGLRQTAREGRTYGGQVVAGTMMAAIAGVVIIGSSLLFTMVAFPDYFRELEAIQRQTLADGGMPAAQIDAAVTQSTPMSQALQGFMGTFVTGILASAIIAIGVKGHPAKRDPARA